MTTPAKLLELSKSSGYSLNSVEFAQLLDKEDELAKYRSQFNIPKKGQVNSAHEKDKDQESIYLCSNSLGLLSKRTRELICQELDAWAAKGVLGHTEHPFDRPWVSIDDQVIPYMAELVGAQDCEVAVMTTLTSNLHFLMTAFYKPSSTRYKILIEDKAFPSDHYAVESQLQLNKIDIKEGLVLIKPRDGEFTLRTEDILEVIREQGETLALILLPGVQYYTGQLLDMKAITAMGHDKGCVVGFDLAHAVGNVELSLHDWDVDFACWCSYKYLSSGPGNIGGLFVHDRYADKPQFSRLTGWWAHELETRFDMDNCMKLERGAKGFRLSNPSVINCVALLGSLELYHEVGMSKFRAKSLLLTGYLECLILNHPKLLEKVQILTPSDVKQRGCQLSLLLKGVDLSQVMSKLLDNGVVCDERKPDVIRVGPYPLVNSYTDIYFFVKYLAECI